MTNVRFFHFLLILVVGLFLAIPAAAQTSQSGVFRALVLDAHEEEPLQGVNVSLAGFAIGAATDADGRVLVSGIPEGPQTVVFSFVGYETVERLYDFPLSNPDSVHVVMLEEEHGEMDEIAISATRTSRTIADLATRVETIAGEEIDEKISMEPSNISMLLNESPGITVQQTSAVSGGASIRIQGLDGRYTQILKDGFPLYGGFSGGLALLQVPPLDLHQVEVIKGPSSTLYGGDAIAGLVNLVSKKPGEHAERSILTNITSAGGYDLGGFFSSRNERVGGTLLASANLQQAYDPDDDSFSNLPQTNRFTLNPTLFVYPSDQTTVSIGVNGTFEEREGGDMDVLEDGTFAGRSFIERNESTRLTSQLRLDHRGSDAWDEVFGGSSMLTIKNSISHFDRSIEVPQSRFSGRQLATYSEASLLVNRQLHDIVVGVDVRSDAFKEDVRTASAARDYTYVSSGLFAQDTWNVSTRVVLETGLRAEYHNTYGLFLLPRSSVLVRVSDRLSTRVGGGLGYKAPTVFLEPSEERAFDGVIPLGDDADAETSAGGSVDVNYSTLLFDTIALSFNQAFYFTELQDPLVPQQISTQLGSGEGIRYVNAEGSIRTRAWETNAKLSYGHVKLFLGYVNLDARADHDSFQGDLPLTPTHRTYTVLVYEKHGTGRIGLEGYYTSPQTLSNGLESDGFLVMGVMAERRFGRARVFLNFENFSDTKQSNFDPVVLGTQANPQFAEIWAPMDGFIVNGGVKYSF